MLHCVESSGGVFGRHNLSGEPCLCLAVGYWVPSLLHVQAEHGAESYQINDWKSCCKFLILRSARVMARDKSQDGP